MYQQIMNLDLLDLPRSKLLASLCVMFVHIIIQLEADSVFPLLHICLCLLGILHIHSICRALNNSIQCNLELRIELNYAY